jgi:DNA-binding NarL/FixJ family response regulator
MASGPPVGLDLRYARIGRAAFALARRICGDDATAVEVVEQALASGGDEPAGAVGDGLVLRRVRRLACERRRPVGPAALGAPPSELSALPLAQWRVLDLVALRGASVREAAGRLQLPEATVLTHLHEGLQRAGALLSGERQPYDNADAPRLALLG